MSARGPGPADRVRARIARALGPTVAKALPRGYQRLGRVLVLRLDESLRPAFPAIGEAWREELGVLSVLRHAGRTDGEFRRPRLERIAGDATETEVREHGARYRFDAARIMFAAGNSEERRRIGRLVRPGERVADLFAGIGYFALPAALCGRAAEVTAVEANPVSFRYLQENVALNGVEGRVRAILGDNRAVDLAAGSADRIVMGYLPSAAPWLSRALSIAAPGAWLHVHLVGGTREGTTGAAAAVRAGVVRGGGRPSTLEAREVKPYGPGRAHYVVDVALAS